ncbi:Cyclic AMP-dependent transcription factor ATF-6 beta [Amphibalanus amphitrite]|nr:Cyclic AMP-dependent transcription factor ATF-6 beta [Amphibalanus amphitrite]
MRSLYSINQVHCSSVSNKERSQSSSESNDDDRNDDIDDSFANFLKESIFDQNPPSGSYDNVMDEAMSDIFSPSPTSMESGLLSDDMLFLAPGGPDLIEGAPDATIDLGHLCPEIADLADYPGGMKPEPRSPPSPGGSDSGVESYSVGFEYCDSPPVTPPQATVTASPPAAIIQVIKQEAAAASQPLQIDTTPQQVICFDSGSNQSSQILPMSRRLQPKGTPLRPAPSVILPQNVSPGSSSTTYIITTPAAAAPAAAPRPAAVIKPRPSGGVPAGRPRPAPAASPDDGYPKARPLPRTVTVPPTRENMDPRALKRQERIIKNRMAACLSRKKKKDQFSEMEARVKEVEQDNGRLREENAQLHRRVAQLQAEVEMLRGGLQAPASPPPSSPRRPLLLLSVLLLASLNLAPLGPLSLSPELSGGGGLDGGAVNRAPGGRTLLWAPAPSDAEADLNDLVEAVNASSGYMCPKYVNQTEARRLSRVLHGWFDPAPARPDNGTVHQPPPVARTAGTARARSAGRQRRKRPSRRRDSVRAAELQLYDRWFGAYGAFLDAIERRDDTFYVVSFNGDHLLLPALSHNQTQRPRMSLLLPSLPLNESMRAPEHYVAMMQIDCEVVNTKLLHIHESAIPTPPSNHSAPTGARHSGDGSSRLNDTGAARGKLNFPAAPAEGLAVDTPLRWNLSASLGRREKVKPRRTVRQPAAPTASREAAPAPTNSSADSWRRLRFRNDSVDGAAMDALSEPAVCRCVAELVARLHWGSVSLQAPPGAALLLAPLLLAVARRGVFVSVAPGADRAADGAVLPTDSLAAVANGRGRPLPCGSAPAIGASYG